MKKSIFKNILLWLFVMFSLVIIFYGIMFVMSQMTNIKYYFDDGLPNSNIGNLPICRKEFINELILFAKFVICYSIYGLIIGIYSIKRK
jgi:hypothetical protein